jgi:hypothetical protein
MGLDHAAKKWKRNMIQAGARADLRTNPEVIADIFGRTGQIDCWGRMSFGSIPATETGFFIASRRNGSPSS